MLRNALPELVIGNVFRRVLFIIREEHANALQAQAHAAVDASGAAVGFQSRSLGTILTPGTHADLSTPIVDLKSVVMDGLSEFMDEIENLHANIADQAMEYIHTECVVESFGLMLSLSCCFLSF